MYYVVKKKKSLFLKIADLKNRLRKADASEGNRKLNRQRLKKQTERGENSRGTVGKASCAFGPVDSSSPRPGPVSPLAHICLHS